MVGQLREHSPRRNTKGRANLLQIDSVDRLGNAYPSGCNAVRCELRSYEYVMPPKHIMEMKDRKEFSRLVHEALDDAGRVGFYESVGHHRVPLAPDDGVDTKALATSAVFYPRRLMRPNCQSNAGLAQLLRAAPRIFVQGKLTILLLDVGIYDRVIKVLLASWLMRVCGGLRVRGWGIVSRDGVPLVEAP